MPLSYDDATELLRGTLLGIAATGDKGFEGLLAGVVAELTGLTFRLAKSGSQFGRDASSTPGFYAISIEAKRYSDDELRLEVLAGKVLLATQLRIDLWIIGTTSTVGDDTLAKLQPLLEESGISLVCLDWASHPLPPLAVALAAAGNATLRWARPHCNQQQFSSFENALGVVAAHPLLPSQLQLLREQLAAPSVGLDALRSHSNVWLAERFGGPAPSRQSFGQIIRQASSRYPTVTRNDSMHAFQEALKQRSARPSVVTVAGEEGTGKTWLIAQWWSQQIAQPIVLLIAGRRVSHLQAGDPVGSLARLLADQDDSRVTESGWRRRLARWKNSPSDGGPRFILILDGLNEQPTMPWADLISELAREIHDLGGTLVATVRPGYWRTEVEPRLGADLTITKIPIADYSAAEFAVACRLAKINAATIPANVREFMRNPRVFSVAAGLVSQLALQPDALTVERLLLQYWRVRLQERGDLIGHSLADLEKVLRSHAAAIRDKSGVRFSNDAWIQHSGAAERKGREAVESDFTEIVEGRFLRPVAGQIGAYEFRPEALPFALGLLTTHELLEAGVVTDEEADNRVQPILQPVSGFARVSEIVAAAVGLACAAPDYPVFARRALIRYWFDLQNTTGDAEQAIASHFTACSSAFLDVAESTEITTRYLDSGRSLSGIILAHRSDPRVRAEIDARIPRWLARWSRATVILPEPIERLAKRQEDHLARVHSALADLSPNEQELFANLTVETPKPPSVDLQRLAVLLLAKGPMSPFAYALLGWAFAEVIGQPMFSVSAEMAWAARSNGLDPIELQDSVRSIANSLTAASSERGRKAIARLLRLLGDVGAATEAEQLVPRAQPKGWRRSDQFREVDPFDPTVTAPGSLDRARTVVSELPPESLWSSMLHTIEDGDVESAMPTLARFEPDTLVGAVRAVARTAETRASAELQQLVWHLLELSPAFDNAVRASLYRSLRAALDDPSRLPAQDRTWMIWLLFAAAAFEMPAQEQRRLLADLPDSPIPLEVLRSLSTLSLDTFETQLKQDAHEWDARAITLTCLFAPLGPVSVATDVGTILVDAVLSSNKELEAVAADAIARLDDEKLDDLVLGRVARMPDALRGRGYLENLVATLIVRRNDAALLPHLSTSVTGWIAAHRTDALTAFAGKIDETLDVLLSPLKVAQPSGMKIIVEVADDERSVTRSVVATASEEHTSLESGGGEAHEYADVAATRNALAERARAYARALDDAGAAMLLAAPTLASLEAVIDMDVARGAAWLQRILIAVKPEVLRQVRNLALALSAAYARYDHNLAAEVVDHVSAIFGVASVSLAGEKVPLSYAALFHAPDIGRFAEWRLRSFAVASTDADLEELVATVEFCGAASWLDVYVDRCIGSATPADQARGLTVSGFRTFNAHSELLLERDWGTGFLGDVATNARSNFQRAKWAAHWLVAALGAPTAAEFWAHSVLLVGSADRRIFQALRTTAPRESQWLHKYGYSLRRRLVAAQEEITKARKKTLFGLDAPSSEIRSVMMPS